MLQICAAFNTIDRVADAMAFAVLPEEHFLIGAKLIKRVGYSLPVAIAVLMRER